MTEDGKAVAIQEDGFIQSAFKSLTDIDEIKIPGQEKPLPGPGRLMIGLTKDPEFKAVAKRVMEGRRLWNEGGAE